MQITLKPKVQQEITEYKTLLHKANIPYEAVIVFGSQVKGTAKPYSDIDLCIVSKKFGNNRHDERVQLMLLTNNKTLDIEPHPFSPSDMNNTWDPLVSEIHKYGIAV